MPTSKPLNWTAIGLGWALRTFGGGIVNAIVVAVALPLVMASRRASGSSSWQVALIMMVVSLAVNAVFAVWSGYLAGRIAEGDETRHAAILGALCFVTTLVTILATRLSFFLRISIVQSGAQLALLGFSALLLFGLTICGGFLAQSKRKPVSASAQPHPFDPIPRV